MRDYLYFVVRTSYIFMKYPVMCLILVIGIVNAVFAGDIPASVFRNHPKYSEALKRALAWSGKEPTEAYSYQVIGELYLKEKAYDSALFYLKLALLADNDSSYASAWAHAYLGVCYLQTRKKKEGVAELNRAVVLSPTIWVRKFANNILDSIGQSRPEVVRPKSYIPDWVKIERKNIRFYFQDTIGITNVVWKYMEEQEEAYEYANRVFQAVLPEKLSLYVWNDEQPTNTRFREFDYVFHRRCFAHVFRPNNGRHQTIQILSFWSWGVESKKARVLIHYGVSVAFDARSFNLYEWARKMMLENNLTDVLEVWDNKKYPKREEKRRKLTAIGGAFVKYLYEKSSPEQFRAIVKNQTVDNAKIVYGAGFDSLISGFNRLMR